MPTAKINGIDLVYEIHGSGPPLLMCAPGGFDSTIQKWSTAGVWAKMDALKTLGQHYRCIAYDRRESGQSGGRVERLRWELYADEGKGLLDHLGLDQAFVLGGCMGVSAPGAEPEELRAMKIPALIIPGDDPAHAMSAAHYLRECLPQADFWPVAGADQEAPRLAERLLAFGAAHS